MTEQLWRECGECKGEGFTFKDTTFQGAKFKTARKCPANCTRGFVPVDAVEVWAVVTNDGVWHVRLEEDVARVLAMDIPQMYGEPSIVPASLVLHSEVGDGG